MKTIDRDEFREAVFARDNGKCVICGVSIDIAAHHIVERCLWEGGGYHVDNGAALCPEHHWEAEKLILSCEEIRKAAGINTVILPPTYDPNNIYDKWGNIIIATAIGIAGPLADSEQFRKIMDKDRASNTCSFMHWYDFTNLIKYPRTRHIVGSGLQKDDKDDYVSFEELKGKHLVVEEKIDGANTGVSFQDCTLKLQCRGHFLGGGGDWPEFDQFKVWGSTWGDQLFDILEDRYIMYGEWMAGFHSVFYDLLPHYFMEFDIYDKKRRVFLSTEARKELISDSVYSHSELPEIQRVRVLESKVFESMDEIMNCMGLSAFISKDAYEILGNHLKHKKVPKEESELLLSLNKDRIMEGLYIKWEENGIVKGRYKYVRPGFVQTLISSGQHWKDRPKIPNITKDREDMS